MVVEGTELPNEYIPFKTTPIKERVANLESKTEELESYISTSQGIESHWKNKKWYAYGTSLTSSAQGKYVPYVAEFSGLNVTNKGIPGGALVSNRNIYNALMDNTDGKINADLITIEVGANDGTAPMGDITSMDTSTFCGALNTCIKNILMNCPKAQVVLLNSTRGRYLLNDPDSLYDLDLERAGGGTTEERDEAIRRVAQANGIYYIPFGCGLGMGLFRLQSSDLYNVDNIHHTELGGYNLAQGVWGYLKNIPLWYTELPE
jgi:lysophospholipase L1-like esterase